MRVYGEPLIQHLVLDESEYYSKDWAHAARRVMSPPFRDKRNQDDLWNGLRAGSLQVVATDHCAFTTTQKELGRGDFTKIPNGTGGLEDRMPVLWTYGVETGRLTMNEFVAVTSTNIARILNSIRARARSCRAPTPTRRLGPQSARRRSPPTTQISVIDYNVFEGVKVRGPAALHPVARRGRRSRDGKVQVEPGRGQFVRREPFPPEARALAAYKRHHGGRRRRAITMLERPSPTTEQAAVGASGDRHRRSVAALR